MDVIFINNVNRVMEEKGMTRKDLATKCDLPTVCIDRVLDRGITLKLDMAVNIADALETTVDKLCGR